MPTYRPQQPTTRNRRVPTIGQPPDLHQIQWTLARESAHRVSIELRLPTTGAEAPFPDLVIKGTPALKVNDTLPTWTVVDITATSFALTCPEELPDAGMWLLAPYDPAIRSSLGGYLLPKLQEIVTTTPLTLASATRQTSTTATAEIAGAAVALLAAPCLHSYAPLGVPRTTPSAIAAVDWYPISLATVEVIFADDISGEAGIEWPNPGMIVDAQGRVMAAESIIFS